MPEQTAQQPPTENDSGFLWWALGTAASVVVLVLAFKYGTPMLIAGVVSAMIVGAVWSAVGASDDEGKPDEKTASPPSASSQPIPPSPSPELHSPAG
jgi:hypothetical protein